MTKGNRLFLLTAFGLICACAASPGVAQVSGYYSLVRPQPQRVARNSMVVTPTMAWNRARRTTSDISREENWTLNGPLLDSLTFIGGLEPGRTVVRQRRREERQVPLFRADMSPPEIASVIESFYRIRAGSVRFEMTGLRPRTFLGHPGFQLDFDHLDFERNRTSGPRGRRHRRRPPLSGAAGGDADALFRRGVAGVRTHCRKRDAERRFLRAGHLSFTSVSYPRRMRPAEKMAMPLDRAGEHACPARTCARVGRAPHPDSRP